MAEYSEKEEKVFGETFAYEGEKERLLLRDFEYHGRRKLRLQTQFMSDGEWHWGKGCSVPIEKAGEMVEKLSAFVTAQAGVTKPRKVKKAA